MKRAGFEADRERISVDRRRDPQEAAVVTEAWDRSAGSITWSARRQDDLHRRPTTSATTRCSRSTSRPATSEAARRQGHQQRAPRRRRSARVRARHAEDARRAVHGQARRHRPAPAHAASTTSGVKRRSRSASTSSSRSRARKGDTVYGYVMKPAGYTRRQGAGRVPDPRRPAGQLRRSLPLPLEPAGLRGPRLRRRCSSTSTARPATARRSPTRSAATGAARRTRT